MEWIKTHWVSHQEFQMTGSVVVLHNPAQRTVESRIVILDKPHEAWLEL